MYNYGLDHIDLGGQFLVLTSSVKNTPFYVSLKHYDKIAHYCLVYGGSGLNVMSKIIMEELGLSCINGNSRSLLSYNSKQHDAIGEIKYVTLSLCVHFKIKTTCNIQLFRVCQSVISLLV